MHLKACGPALAYSMCSVNTWELLLALLLLVTWLKQRFLRGRQAWPLPGKVSLNETSGKGRPGVWCSEGAITVVCFLVR